MRSWLSWGVNFLGGHPSDSCGRTMADSRTVYYVFQFLDGRYIEVTVGHYPSRMAALRLGSYGANFVETEIVVHPKKGQSFHNPVTHTLAHLAKEKPGVWFIAVVEEERYRLLCQQAEAEWAAEKAKVRELLARTPRQHGPANLDNLPDRLKNRIQLDASGCWLWITLARRRTRWGLRPRKEVRSMEYGSMNFAGRKEGAHRVVYRLLAGDIPDGAFLLHSCDTPACVNPDHLRLGIAEDNVRDWLARRPRR
jgi:HNH endonuclease